MSFLKGLIGLTRYKDRQGESSVPLKLMENEFCDNTIVILGLFQMIKTYHNSHFLLINQPEVQFRRKEGKLGS